MDVLKRDYSGVDWDKVDWKAIDWNKVVNWATVSYTYSSGQTWGESTAAPAAQATTLASVVVAAVPTPSTTEAAATSAPAATSAAAATTSKASSGIISNILAASDKSKILSLGLKAVGLNPTSNTGGGVWIGDDSNYKNTFTNNAGEDIILTCWGSAGSWVNAIVPQITVTLGDGDSTTLSFADGHSGACSAIYSDTELVNGQLSNTWLEHTFGSYGTFDVSREVNMNGHSISAVGEQCTSDMTTCVFECVSGTTCTTGYTLKNCGSSNGGGAGTYDGAASGGCMMASGGDHIKTTFS